MLQRPSSSKCRSMTSCRTHRQLVALVFYHLSWQPWAGRAQRSSPTEWWGRRKWWWWAGEGGERWGWSSSEASEWLQSVSTKWSFPHNYNLWQFTREMTIGAKLCHPNLLLFVGATMERDPVILTELMPTSLCKELEKGELARRAIISISQDVACGLSYLQQWKPHPIIHRDNSSGNVLLEPFSNTWRAKTSDYGSANFMNPVSSTVGPGCSAYAAPDARFLISTPQRWTCSASKC